MQKSKYSVILLLCVMLRLIANAEANIERKFYGPYCGIYCTYLILQTSEKDIDFRSLLKPEYVSNHKGSTLKDLKQSLEDNGFYAKPVKKLSLENLKVSDKMMILSTKRDFKDNFNHYVLYLGKKGNEALIFSPPDPIKTILFSELAALWSRNALIISKEPIDLGAVLMPGRIRLVIYIAIALICIGVYHLLFLCFKRTVLFKSITRDKFWFKFGVSVIQTAGILTVVFVVSVMYNLLALGGLLSPGGEAVEGVQNTYAGSFIPKISQKTMADIVGSDTLIIDCRYKRDYDSDHLDGAINVEVNAPTERISEIMSKYPKDTDIVLYCQSEGCPFAKKMALKLKEISYEKIRIFKGGYNEWAQRNK